MSARPFLNEFRARKRRREARLYVGESSELEKKQRRRKLKTVAEHIHEHAEKHLDTEPTLLGDSLVGECLELKKCQRNRLSELGLAWVVDKKGRLTGYVGAAELLLSPPMTQISAIAKPTRFLRMDEPLENALHLLRAEDVAVAPVVDSSGIIVAALAPTEVIDVFEQEATEDVAKIALSGAAGASYFDANYLRIVRDRTKWLLSLLMFQSLSSVVLNSFSSLLSSNLTLALFLTMITGTSGNAGNQSSAVVIRGLATGDIKRKDTLRVLLREFKVAFPVAVVLAIASFIRVVVTNGAMLTALAITIAMAATVFSAIAIGAGAPLLLDSLGIDPANCASPTLATAVDLLGVLLLCTISSALLPL